MGRASRGQMPCSVGSNTKEKDGRFMLNRNLFDAVEGLSVMVSLL